MKLLLTLITLLLPATLLAESVPSFRQDIMPVFFRAGCNAGTCHGAAKGKDGFMLSPLAITAAPWKKFPVVASTRQCPLKACCC